MVSSHSLSLAFGQGWPIAELQGERASGLVRSIRGETGCGTPEEPWLCFLNAARTQIVLRTGLREGQNKTIVVWPSAGLRSGSTEDHSNCCLCANCVEALETRAQRWPGVFASTTQCSHQTINRAQRTCFLQAVSSDWKVALYYNTVICLSFVAQRIIGKWGIVRVYTEIFPCLLY